MTDQTSEQNEQTEESGTPSESENIKNLREAAARGTQAQRELAWVKAGFDTDDPLIATVMGTYNGDLTKDAVVEYAKSLNLEPVGAAHADPPADPEPNQSESEQRRQSLIESHHNREMLKNTSNPNDGTDLTPENPHTRGLKGYREALAEGFSREEAAGEYIGSVIQAAKEGDERATFKGWQGDDAVRASGR